MSSSSIEVMGGGDGQMILVESDNVEAENLEERELQTLESAEPSIYTEEMEVDDYENGNDDGFSSLGLPPGSLLFSPQDVASSPLSKRGRGRGRGRGKGPGTKKGTALTIKLEDGVDYSRINLPVACEICGRIMANGKTLVQHMTTHVRNKELQCPHCPKSFSKMVQLQGHLVFHGIQKQFECPICHQRFSRQDCVRVHMRLHDKSKCVFCVVCHKAFLTLGALNIHMRIHRGEKPFKCHLCGKCFTQKNHVITHIKRHTKMASNPFSKKLGPRMFQCEHCPRSFIRLSDYERHVQWNHGAVADNNIMNKHDNENLLVDKYSGDSFAAMDDFISPSKTLNHKVKKRGHSIGFRRTMCTIGTQTDEEGGRIIIPRKYQNASSMTTSSTQVSAPPTPRPTEEELYENDIFDEGMDRNYSSDEDDIDDDRKDHINILRDSEISTSEYPQQTYVSSSSQDDAFDAVLGKSKPVEELKSASIMQNAEDNSTHDSKVETSHSDAEKGNENTIGLSSESDESSSDPTKANDSKLVEEDLPVNLEFATPNSIELLMTEPENKLEPKSSELQQDTVTQIEPQGSSVMEATKKLTLPQVVQKKPDPKIPKLLSKKVNAKIIKPVITQSLKATFSTAKESKISQIGKGEAEPMIRVPVNEANRKPTGTAHVQHHAKILDTFNTKNWKGRTQGRVRGRGRVKGVIGLTGATHLRLIRKSMMNFISEKVEEMNEKEKKHKPIHKKIAVVERSTSKVAKRQGKSKQHGADFVCDLRSCETCRPNQTQESTEDSSSDIEMSDSQPQTSLSSNSSAPKDQSQKLLQFLISGDASNLHGTEFRLLNEIKPYDTTGTTRDIESASIYVPSAATIANLPSSLIDEPSVRERINITNHLHDKNEFFSAVASQGDDIISPPVELQAFCIPTYSCKLCGREFRFEGKLHRHIEAVHQKKEIFSPDVRPGRGPSKYIEYEGTDFTAICNAAEDSSEAVIAAQNPEIEALRSEWDDDDDEEDEDEDGDLDIKVPTAPVATPSTSSQNIGNQASSSFQRRPQLVMNPIITREIVATTNTVTDVYIRGVRMNINKLTGLAGNSSPVEFIDNYYVKKSNLAEEVTPVPTISVAEKEIDTLDSKCRRLLEKLFDHDLLIQCGLYEEHVSVVLGRILQHYGVKMIEDYGQGQYEVLKYNLWRLIEWKVTMEQMEEFYTEGKSVEEMMDDIMNGRVPIIAHHELMEERSEHDQGTSHSQENQIETVQISDGHLVLSQVANVLSGQLNLGEGVTQVVLAQDVSPELLQGAHIVTIDPTTGQVLSQVTADQVILADSVSDELGQQIQTINGQVVVTEGQTITVTSLPPGSIVSNNSTSTTVHFSHISEDGQILDSSIEQRIEKLPNS